MKFWPKKKKKEAGIFYDIIPPLVIKRMILAQKKASLWLRGFRLFLKTSRYGTFAVLAFIVLGGLTVWAIMPKEEIKSVNIYPTKFGGDVLSVSDSGEAGWKNVEKVLGAPEVSTTGSLESFSENNSAVYKSGPYSLILSDFLKTEKADNLEGYSKSELKSAKIKFSFAMGEKKADLKIQGNENKLPIEKPPVESSPSPAFTAEPSLELSVSPAEIISSPEVLLQPSPEASTSTEATEDKTADEAESSDKITPVFSPIPEIFTEPAPESTTIISTEPDSSRETGFLENFKKIFAIQNAKADDNKENLKDGIKDETVFSSSEPTSEITDFSELPNMDAKIIVWYSTGSDVWWQAGIISGYSLSNASNSGYFSYDLPLLKNWDDLKNLKIKFEGVVGGETTAVSYLDSVWVEAEYAKVNDIEKEMDVNDAEIKNISSKNNFKRDENPEFKFQRKKPNKGFIMALGKALGIADSQKNIKTAATFINPRGEDEDIQHEVSFDANGDIVLKVIKPQKEFRPGLYKVKVQVEDSGQTEEFEQSFEWGVLAINTNKSIYLSAEALAKEDLPPEQAYLQMASLNEYGHTRCNSKLELKIKNSITGAEEIFFTENGTIKNSETCGASGVNDNVTDSPDYYVYYQIGDFGIYQMTLKNLDNSYEITDSFEVKDLSTGSGQVLFFEVERVGATRINPFKANYWMKIKVKANEDFSGEVTETLPADFNVTQSANARVESQNNAKQIIWRLDLKAGDTVNLEYEYDAPDVSPEIYLFGPLEFKQDGNVLFEEARQWQIASDAIITTAGSGNWNSTSNNAPWPGGTVPASTDDVIIAIGNTVTVPSGYNATQGCSLLSKSACYRQIIS